MERFWCQETYDEGPRVLHGVFAADDTRRVVIERQHLLGSDTAGVFRVGAT